MKIRRLLVFLAGMVLTALVILYVQFLKANEVSNAQDESINTIRVLAPYETALQQQILEEIGSEYGRIPGNPQIVYEFVPKENMKKELSLRSLAGKEKVNVVICDSGLMPELIRINILKEVPVPNELYERVSQRQLWSSTRDNGKYYGVPFTCDPYVLYYRTDRLEEHDQSVPTTWEELIDCGQAIQKTGIKSIGIALKRSEETANIYRIMLYSMGGNFHGINQETGMESFENFQKMSRYALLGQEMMNYTQQDLAREFAEGRISLMINQMSAATILRTNQISFEIGVAKVPDDEAGGTFLTGENIGLTKDTDMAAWDFVKYLTEANASERISNAMGTLPVFSDVTYHQKSKVYLENAEALLDEARIPEPYNSWTKISEAITDGVYEMLGTNMANAEEIADQVHDKVRVAIMSG
ncbi:MAG: extracellular solute-binding protein [Clostridia bacterium]|nr:extracellular solute-binding protein [Clostridia bacterium]NCC44242.1 extracellular solute-binding protein [Clostridia bacterium]